VPDLPEAAVLPGGNPKSALVRAPVISLSSTARSRPANSLSLRACFRTARPASSAFRCSSFFAPSGLGLLDVSEALLGLARQQPFLFPAHPGSFKVRHPGQAAGRRPMAVMSKIAARQAAGLRVEKRARLKTGLMERNKPDVKARALRI
jgi:hypothetical protein